LDKISDKAKPSVRGDGKQRIFVFEGKDGRAAKGLRIGSPAFLLGLGIFVLNIILKF
jgi:hypothetical protein